MSDRTPAPPPLSQPEAERPWLEPLLAGLTAWALLQAVLVWWRPPAPPAPALPQRMQWQGRWLERRPSAPPVTELMDGMEVQSGADYSAPGAPRLLLRWMVRTSSGDGVRFEPDQIAKALIGPKATGVCRVYDPASGRLLGIAASGAATKALLRRSDPDGWQRLQWAAGLRPWRLNRCLFVGVAPR